MLKVIDKENKKLYLPITILLTLLTVIAATIYSKEISEFTKNGLELCYKVIIGSVFPFMIITDILCAGANFDSFPFLSKAFERTFKINAVALSAFAVGILCGFPIGVKVAMDLYKSGQITKNECERLICFSNNTGPAFIISGIGAGMRANLKDGFILYFSMVISAIVLGFLLGIGKNASERKPCERIVDFKFTESVKAATSRTLSVCGFVVIFSVICGFTKIFIKNEFLYSMLIPFLEIGNAAKFLSASKTLTPNFSLVLTSFAVSFSGFSVHMQAQSFMDGTKVSVKLYYFSKLIQGLIAALICEIILHL